MQFLVEIFATHWQKKHIFQTFLVCASISLFAFLVFVRFNLTQQKGNPKETRQLKKWVEKKERTKGKKRVFRSENKRIYLEIYKQSRENIVDYEKEGALKTRNKYMTRKTTTEKKKQVKERN